MVKNCCIKGCKSLWFPNQCLSFFSFPFKNASLLKEWQQVIPDGHVSKSSVICSKHFQESDFKYKGHRRMLNECAVPSRFANDIVNDKDLNRKEKSVEDRSKSLTNMDVDLKRKVVHKNSDEKLFCDTDIEGSCNNLQDEDKIIVLKYYKLRNVKIPRHSKTVNEREIILQRQICILQKENRRLQNRCQNMTGCIKILQKRVEHTEELEKIVLERCTDYESDLGSVIRRGSKSISSPIMDHTYAQQIIS